MTARELRSSPSTQRISRLDRKWAASLQLFTFSRQHGHFLSPGRTWWVTLGFRSLLDATLTWILLSPRSWILWDLAHPPDRQWLWDSGHSGMSVTPLHCKPFFRSGCGEWAMTPCYGGTEAHPLTVKKKRREKKTSICGCDIVQTFIFSHTSIHSVILEGPAVLFLLQSMSHAHTHTHTHRQKSEIVGF